MKVWDWAGMEFANPGSAVRHVSAARHVNDCAMWPCVSTVVTRNVLKSFVQDQIKQALFWLVVFLA